MIKLTSFVWQNIKLFDDSSFAKFFKCLNVLQMHKSIENIIFEIHDSNMLINNLFYDKLFNFCKVKQNTKIIITISKSKSETDQDLMIIKSYLMKLNICLNLI